jgi:type IV pilus assembly protein PilN
MRITVNLATRPFLELGPLYRRLRILIAALAVLSLFLWLILHTEQKKAQDAKARLAAVQQKIDALNNQRQQFEASMAQPPNSLVLKQAVYLNRLFQRKAFSWTAVMMDLENVLPTGVQVMNIDPVISRSGEVTIHLRVRGQRDRAVLLVRNLEHSRRFLFPRLAGENAETSYQNGRGVPQANGNDVDFDILAEYNPLTEGAAPKEREKKKAKASASPSEAKPERLHRNGIRAHGRFNARSTRRPSPGRPAGAR